MQHVSQVIETVTREIFKTMIPGDLKTVECLEYPAAGEPMSQRAEASSNGNGTHHHQVSIRARWARELTAMVGLAGQRPGVLAIHCPRTSAGMMVRSMLGELEAELSPTELRDAMGEIANMIAGAVKLWHVGEGRECSLSIPTVVEGQDLEIEVLDARERPGTEFTFDGQPFKVELMMAEQAAHPRC